MRGKLYALLTAGATALALAPAAAAATAPPATDSWTPPPGWNPAQFSPALVKLLPLDLLKTKLEPRRPLPIVVAMTSVDLSAWSEPVGNQGGLNSCVGWAVGYGLDGWWANRKAKLPASDYLHPMELWAPLANYKDTGIDPQTAMARVAQLGVTPKSQYAWNDYNNLHKPTAGEVAAGAPYRFSSWRNLFYVEGGGGASGASMIRKELLAGRPVAVTLRVYSDLLVPAPTNPYTRVAGATVKGLHELLALGFDGSGLWVQNSWGTGWGNAGRLRLSWATVSSDLIEADVADGLVP